jgi:hypothetical protein
MSLPSYDPSHAEYTFSPAEVVEDLATVQDRIPLRGGPSLHGQILVSSRAWQRLATPLAAQKINAKRQGLNPPVKREFKYYHDMKQTTAATNCTGERPGRRKLWIVQSYPVQSHRRLLCQVDIMFHSLYRGAGNLGDGPKGLGYPDAFSELRPLCLDFPKGPEA